MLEEVDGCARSLPFMGVVVPWFPRAMVKKVKRLVSVIPCGQGILRGMDCYGHKLKSGKDAQLN